MQSWRRVHCNKINTVTMTCVRYPLHAKHCSKHFLCKDDFVEHNRGRLIFRFMDFPISLSSVSTGGGCFTDEYDFLFTQQLLDSTVLDAFNY